VIAQSVGLNVPFARLMLISLSAVLTALATLIIGPMSFMGLLAPHLARLLGFYKPQSQYIAAIALGMWCMVLADWLGRYVMFPYEVPAGLVATLLGGGIFLLMMRKLGKSA
jgi:iron complex transport system permease protein